MVPPSTVCFGGRFADGGVSDIVGGVFARGESEQAGSDEDWEGVFEFHVSVRFCFD